MKNEKLRKLIRESITKILLEGFYDTKSDPTRSPLEQGPKGEELEKSVSKLSGAEHESPLIKQNEADDFYSKTSPGELENDKVASTNVKFLNTVHSSPLVKKTDEGDDDKEQLGLSLDEPDEEEIPDEFEDPDDRAINNVAQDVAQSDDIDGVVDRLMQTKKWGNEKMGSPGAKGDAPSGEPAPVSIAKKAAPLGTNLRNKDYTGVASPEMSTLPISGLEPAAGEQVLRVHRDAEGNVIPPKTARVRTPVTSTPDHQARLWGKLRKDRQLARDTGQPLPNENDPKYIAPMGGPKVSVPQRSDFPQGDEGLAAFIKARNPDAPPPTPPHPERKDFPPGEVGDAAFRKANFTYNYIDKHGTEEETDQPNQRTPGWEPFKTKMLKLGQMVPQTGDINIPDEEEIPEINPMGYEDPELANVAQDVKSREWLRQLQQEPIDKKPEFKDFNGNVEAFMKASQEYNDKKSAEWKAANPGMQESKLWERVVDESGRATFKPISQSHIHHVREMKPVRPKPAPPEAPAVRRMVHPNEAIGVGRIPNPLIPKKPKKEPEKDTSKKKKSAQPKKTSISWKEGKSEKITVPNPDKPQKGRLDAPPTRVVPDKKKEFKKGKIKHKNSIAWD